MTLSAVTLLADGSSVVVEPEFGGRITSIHLGGREWLQQPAVALRPAATFDAFVRPDMGGWDEMVPTCSAVVDQGVALPDHGEVWSRQWHVVASTSSTVDIEIECDIVPLRVRRLARLDRARLRLDYAMTNVGTAPTALFWMAHPLFDATSLNGVSLRPAGVTLRRTVSSADEPDSEPRLLPADLPTGGYRKYRADGTVSAALLEAQDGTKLHMSWRAPIPIHVQLWVDNAGVGPVPVVAIEPAIAAGDHPSEARRVGALPELAPGASLEFSVTLSTA